MQVRFYAGDTNELEGMYRNLQFAFGDNYTDTQARSHFVYQVISDSQFMTTQDLHGTQVDLPTIRDQFGDRGRNVGTTIFGPHMR